MFYAAVPNFQIVRHERYLLVGVPTHWFMPYTKYQFTFTTLSAFYTFIQKFMSFMSHTKYQFPFFLNLPKANQTQKFKDSPWPELTLFNLNCSWFTKTNKSLICSWVYIHFAVASHWRSFGVWILGGKKRLGLAKTWLHLVAKL